MSYTINFDGHELKALRNKDDVIATLLSYLAQSSGGTYSVEYPDGYIESREG